MRKILFLANHFITLYSFRKELIKKLAEEGNEVYLSLPESEENKYFEELGCKIVPTEIDRRGVNPVKDLKLIAFYKKMIPQINPDIIFSYTIKPNIYGTMASNGKYKQVCNVTGTGGTFLKENLVSKNNTFYCNGHTSVAGQRYGCWRSWGHGTQTLQQAIANSCNPAFITIGQLVGVNTFSKYFKAFGFAEKTGIDLPGESRSTYHKQENMGVVELASSSFGQTFNVTPIQMMAAVSAAVNGGYLVQPHLVSKTVDQNNKIVSTTTTTYKRQVISKTTSQTMRELMGFVALNGAKNSLVPGYKIGAKTGTSQKVSKIQATGDTYLYISSCMTVAPIDNPEIAVLVMLDEPKGSNYYGGVISAPVNAKIMADVLPYLGYEPSYTDEEIKKLAIDVPDAVGLTVDEAKAKVTGAKLEYKIVGSGDKVIRQLPEVGNKVSTGGVVILYTEKTESAKVTVPNFTGYTATEVNTTAAKLGLNIEFSGNIAIAGLKAYSQSVAQGTQVDVGTIVTVYFRDETAVD